MAKNQTGTDCTHWRTRAISYLLRHTRATRQIVEHFVNLHWLEDATDEENLDQFEMYSSDVMAVFTF